MNRYTVTVQAIPTAYSRPACYVVEAGNEDDARQIVKHQIGDLSGQWVNVYTVKPWEAPPAGRVLSVPA